MLLGGLAEAVMVAVFTDTGALLVTGMASIHSSPGTPPAPAGTAAASPAQLAMMARSVGRKREIGVYVCMEGFLASTHRKSRLRPQGIPWNFADSLQPGPPLGVARPPRAQERPEVGAVHDAVAVHVANGAWWAWPP